MRYVLDQEALNMTILDTTLPPERMKGNIPFKRYVRTIIQMEQDYMLGMKAQGSGWKAIGIFYWKTVIPNGIPVDRDTSLSVFHVLQLMVAWNNGQLTRINMVLYLTMYRMAKEYENTS